MFNARWKSKADLGQPAGICEQLPLVVRQYARFAVSTKLDKAEILREKGSFHRIVCSFSATQALKRHFELRASAITVINKEFHLFCSCSFADSYYG